MTFDGLGLGLFYPFFSSLHVYYYWIAQFEILRAGKLALAVPALSAGSVAWLRRSSQVTEAMSQHSVVCVRTGNKLRRRSPASFLTERAPLN